MGGRVECKVNGQNIYEGQKVYVMWKRSGTSKWLVEHHTVENGMVNLEDSIGPLENQRYWVGLSYESLMKTFPIKEAGQTNKVSRISHVDVYVDKSGNGYAEAGDEITSHRESIGIDEAPYSGKKRIQVGSTYGEEPYIKVLADGYRRFNLLAIDVNFRQYER